MAVRADGRRLLAKSVSAPGYAQRFADGLAAAARLSAAGIPAGAPVPTLDDALTALVGDQALALLEWVDGIPVDQGASDGQEMIGRTLARASSRARRCARAGAYRAGRERGSGPT